MAETIKTGTVLIKDGTFLPDALRFESEPCVTGWRLVKDLDGYGLDRKIHDAGWTFFCQAAEIKASVFGIAEHQMVRRAIERILGDSKSERFNALEITQMTSLGSERFPVVRYLTVSAHSRHIQESLILFSAKDPEKLVPSGTDWEPACEEFDSRLVLLAAGELTPDEEADVAITSHTVLVARWWSSANGNSRYVSHRVESDRMRCFSRVAVLDSKTRSIRRKKAAGRDELRAQPESNHT